MVNETLLEDYLQRERDFKERTAKAAVMVERAYQNNRKGKMKFNYRSRKTGVGVKLTAKQGVFSPSSLERYVRNTFPFASRIGDEKENRFRTTITFFIDNSLIH